MKALYAELGENHLNHRIGDYATDIPPGPPRPGPDETDWKVSRVHSMLETHIRGERIALLANMRAFPPRGTVNEVWNQAIYKYIANIKAIPGRGPRAVLIDIEVHTNSGSSLNGQDDKDRVIQYQYSLVYGLDGKVDETNPAATDWISVGGEALYAPLNVLQVLDSQWAGHNPYVNLENVRSLDLANGGGNTRRFAGKRPDFLPVAQFEAGRAPLGGNSPMFAGNQSDGARAPGSGSSGPSSVAEPRRRIAASPARESTPPLNFASSLHPIESMVSRPRLDRVFFRARRVSPRRRNSFESGCLFDFVIFVTAVQVHRRDRRSFLVEKTGSTRRPLERPSADSTERSTYRVLHTQQHSQR